MSYDDFRKVVVFRDQREEAVRLSDAGRLAAFEAMFWESLASLSELELLQLAEFWTANVTAMPTSLYVNLVDVEVNDAGGVTSVISARTCTNELTVPNYRIEAPELTERLQLLLQAYEALPQFDTI